MPRDPEQNAQDRVLALSTRAGLFWLQGHKDAAGAAHDDARAVASEWILDHARCSASIERYAERGMIAATSLINIGGGEQFAP